MPYSARVVAPALMVMAVILFMGAVSGAHLNPAVSIAFALRRDFPWKRVPLYVIAQFAGAVLATLLLWALLGKQCSAGLTLPGHGISAGAAHAAERQPGHLAAWHARSGQQAWTRAVPAGAFAVASGSVAYLAAGRTLTAVAATTGRTLWSYQLGADVADVAAGGDVVYALDEHGGVYALRI